jgi:hypothetical protein
MLIVQTYSLYQKNEGFYFVKLLVRTYETFNLLI